MPAHRQCARHCRREPFRSDKGVDQCWSQKEKLIAEAELPQARADYEHARGVYRKRLAEAEVE